MKQAIYAVQEIITVCLISVCLIFGLQSKASAETDSDVISFNKAPASDFTQIQIVTVSEALANAIVSYREANGPYKTPEDLKKIPGMTDDIFEGLDPIEEDGDIIFEKAGGPEGMNAY